MYYILKADGTFLFELPYCFDFCMHCLFNLLDNPDPNLRNCRLVQFELVRCSYLPLSVSSTRLSAFLSNCEMSDCPVTS